MTKTGLIVVLTGLLSAGALAADAPQGSKATVQVVNDKTPQPADQGVLTLDDVVRTALAKNPAVQSAAHTVAAQRAKVPQARFA